MTSGKQTDNGKAFEYSLLTAFQKVTGVSSEDNSSLKVSKSCFDGQKDAHKVILSRASEEVARFLYAHDKNIQMCYSISLQDDKAGVSGDVRDIVMTYQKGEVGISAKHNHSAVKHSRLSDTIDFGKKWTGFPCSPEYFNSINSTFGYLKILREKGELFANIERKDTQIYLPILTAFEDEIKRLCQKFGSTFVENLFKYLLGKYDFYKVLIDTNKKNVSIQSVNLSGTLAYGEKWKIPDRIESVNRQPGSNNKINITFNGGWSISFRIHNASSRVEPSLKFDIQFIGMSSKVTKHDIYFKQEPL